jgi:UDP-N-acetyl-D-glucosamine dehydrogenase
MNMPGYKVAVIGLGYVGLPLAALCAKKGYTVVGLDANESVVESLNSGKCHIRDEAVEQLLAEAVASTNFSASANQDEISDCNIYLICVPTPVDENNDPDLLPLESACRIVAPNLEKGDLVVVESTVFPGTCEDIVAPLLEELSGLHAGNDFYLAHCPERVNPGDLFWTSENIPRVVGATSNDGVDLAAMFYASILGGDIFDVREIKQSLYPKFRKTADGLHVSHVPLGSVTKMHSIRDAEAVKAMENTVRDVNIAFVNELAKISDVLGLDVVDIIDGMATKPFGKGPFYPGVGVGGHCIAVDPEWLKAASKKAGYMPEMIQLARMTNNGMPEYSVSILQDLLNERGYPIRGTRIAVLGVAYKRNVDDPRESPFFKLRDLLIKMGALINVYDSWVSSENTVSSLVECLQQSRAIIIVTEHSDILEQLEAIDLADFGVDLPGNRTQILKLRGN